MNVLIIRPAASTLEIERSSEAIARKFAATVVTTRDTHPLPLLRSIRRAKSELRAADVVHAFGASSLAGAIACGARRLIYTPARWPSVSAVAWLRAAMSYRGIDILCSSDALRRRFVTRGVPIERTHLVRPGVAMNAVPTQPDNALRQRLGATADEFLLFAPGDASPASGHTVTMWGTSIAHVLNPRYRLIVRGSRAVPDDLRARLLNPDSLIDASAIAPDLSTEQLFGAADAVAFLPRGPISPLLVAMAMASGRPIVATPTPQVCEMLEDRHTAILLADPSPKQVAQRIDELFHDAPLRWKLADRARAEAYDYFTTSKMLSAVQSVYESVGATKTV